MLADNIITPTNEWREGSAKAPPREVDGRAARETKLRNEIGWISSRYSNLAFNRMFLSALRRDPTFSFRSLVPRR